MTVNKLRTDIMWRSPAEFAALMDTLPAEGVEYVTILYETMDKIYLTGYVAKGLDGKLYGHAYTFDSLTIEFNPFQQQLIAVIAYNKSE